MRTRKIIEEFSIQDYRAGMSETDQLTYILEVLLDIRDLLANPPIINEDRMATQEELLDVVGIKPHHE